MDPYHHFSHHYEQLPTGLSAYAEAQAMHRFNMAQQSAPMHGLPTQSQKTETKPRLGKDEVEVLEKEFQKNPKPTTQTKRGFAENMGVDLSRINNWFQNRRAKRKQEKRQEAYEAGKSQETQAYSEPSSPENFNGSSYLVDNISPLQHAATFPLVNGPTPPVASYNPQYSNPSDASKESLQRTIAQVQAAHNASQEYCSFLERHGSIADSMSGFGGPLIQDTPSNDCAQFPSPEDSVSPFENGNNFPYSSSYNDLYMPTINIPGLAESPEPLSKSTPIQFNMATPPVEQSMSHSIPQITTTFPSQLLRSKGQDLAEFQSNNDGQSPEGSVESPHAIAFRYGIQESEELALPPPPPSSLPFRSPPPPMDIASRRKKVHSKPAALTADTLRSRPSMGPRTVSHAEGFRRQSDSPLPSPMRRIVSAGGNRSGISGRIQKPTFDSAQRSPINFNGFSDASAFMEHNYHSIRNPPNMTAGSTLNNSLAPPTPLSPREREMTLGKMDGSRSTASPIDGNMNFLFTVNPYTIEADQNLASPPETPQVNVANGWPSADYHDKQWHFEVPDEPQFTPAQDTFPTELHMPQPTQPSYLASISQPVTPAFGHFSSTYHFRESPQFKAESPSYTLSSQSHTEYTFPDSHPTFPMLNSPINKQKTFQFSNTTQADFSEK